MIAPAFLTGQDVSLRALTEADCSGAYLNWFNDPEVCRLNGHHLFPYRQADALEYVKRVRGSPTDLVLAIALNADGRHIGNVSLQGIDPVNRSAEFAIVIGEKDCWGKGYSKQAGRLLLSHGFLELNLHRIHCGLAEGNVAMERLALSLGMQPEGRRRQALYKEGRYLDILEYGVLREEYLQQFHS